MHPMTLHDLPAVARIHKVAYPRTHTSAHFPERLLQAMYGRLLEAGAWGFVTEGGFVLGGGRAQLTLGMTRFRQRERWALIRAGLTTPGIWPLALRRAQPAPEPPSPAPRLLSIAVDPARHRQGVARALAHAFAQAVARRGWTEYRTSVRASNPASRAFFRSLGGREVAVSRDTVVLAVPVAETPEAR